MANTRTYQVWALLRTERGTESWTPVTDKLQSERKAKNLADSLWLETRIEQDDPEPEDESPAFECWCGCQGDPESHDLSALSRRR